MKKILRLAVCTLAILIVCTGVVNAQDITLQDVVKQIETDGYYTSMDSENSSTAVTSDENSIVYTYTITPEDGTKKEYKSTFSYKDGVIYFEYVGDKQTTDAYNQILLNNIAANGIIFAVGTLNNVDETLLWESYDSFSKFNYEKYGLKYQVFQYSNSDVDGWEVETEAVENFKIDINNFNLEGKANLVEPTNSEILEDSGEGRNILLVVSVVVVCLVVVAGIVVLVIKKKK